MDKRSVVDFSCRFPDRAARAAAQYRRAKPLASITLDLEGGDRHDVSLSSRTARAFTKEPPALPAPFAAVREYLEVLDARTCFAALVELLSRRDHGEFEARAKLRDLGFLPSSVDAAIQRARTARYLDDVRYMRYFIEERKRRGWGRRKVELELSRKGLDPAVLPGYPDAFFDEEDDLARARDLLSRKRIPEDRAFEKLVRFLLGKGFSYDIASDAVRSTLAER